MRCWLVYRPLPLHLEQHIEPSAIEFIFSSSNHKCCSFPSTRLDIKSADRPINSKPETRTACCVQVWHLVCWDKIVYSIGSGGRRPGRWPVRPRLDRPTRNDCGSSTDSTLSTWNEVERVEFVQTRADKWRHSFWSSRNGSSPFWTNTNFVTQSIDQLFDWLVKTHRLLNTLSYSNPGPINVILSRPSTSSKRLTDMETVTL